MANTRTGLTFFVAAGLVLALAGPAFGQGVPVEPGTASPQHFRSAATCECHAALVAQWGQSMHSQALTDPVFQTKVALAQQQAGPEVAAACKRCHSPIGNILGDPDGATYIEAAEGVTCMFCHQVLGDSGAHGNTSQLIAPDLTRRAQIEHPVAPHPAAFSAFSTTSQFCGGCHSVKNLAGVAIDSTYAEWAASPYAKKGVQCQDCHMSGTPGVPGPTTGKAAPFGPVRRDLYEMSFVGANVGQGPAPASAEMLGSAARVAVRVSDVVAPGSRALVAVTVTNTGAGHDLPTGLSEERQMWLSVYAVSSDGSTTPLGERRFGTVFADANGTHPAEIWNAARVYSDTRIRAQESTSSVYTFKMPVGADHSDVVAVLNYRSLSDALASQAQVPNPTTEMASDRKTVYASGAQRAASAATAQSETALNAAQPDTWPPGSIWTPLLVALAFVVGIGALSVGILSLQKR